MALAESTQATRHLHGAVRTLLELADEDAVRLLYVRDEPRTEQEIRSAVHVLRGLTAEAFTDACRHSAALRRRLAAPGVRVQIIDPS